MTSEVRSNWVHQTPDLSPLSVSSNLGLGGRVLPASHPRLENRKYGGDGDAGTSEGPCGTASARLRVSAQQKAVSSVLSMSFFLLRALRRGSHLLFLGLRGSEDGLTPWEPQPGFLPLPRSSSQSTSQCLGGGGEAPMCRWLPSQPAMPLCPSLAASGTEAGLSVAVGPLLMAPRNLEGAPGGLCSLFPQDVRGRSSPQPLFQTVGVAYPQADPHSTFVTGRL